MATMIIRDDALWARHIEGDPELAQRIRALPENDAIVLRVEGRTIRFRKMRDGRDGRPTDGLKPDPHFLTIWRGLQARRADPGDGRARGRSRSVPPLIDHDADGMEQPGGRRGL